MGRALRDREWPRVWLIAVVLALVMTAPLTFHLGSGIADATDDPLLQAWQVAWDGHAVLHQPLHVFDANVFWPERRSLAFSDSLLGYAPAGMVGAGPNAALLRYNALYLFAYALAFAAMWFLARELGLRPLGAAVAAAAFAYAPWRASQAAHLHVLSSGGIPLTAFLLIHGYRRRSARYVVAGWVAAAWQVSLGFSLGLQLLYAMLIAVPLIAWATWLRPDGMRLALRQRGMVAATVGGAVALAAISLALARPYMQVRDDHPESVRSEATVSAFSPLPLSFLVAPPENVVWGYRTSGLLDHLYTKDRFAPNAEKTLFPGLMAVLLALVGLAGPPFRRSIRLGLAGATVALALLALGASLGRASPYRLLYDIAPGWDAVRTPGRVMTLATLTLGLLAGAGADRLWSWARGRGRRLLPLLPLLVLLEGWSPPSIPDVPRPPRGFAAVPGPVLHLPSDRFADARYMYWSTDGFTPVVNGWSGFEPATLVQVRAATREFPNAAGGTRLLRRLGVRSVVVHRDGRAPRVYRLR